MCCTSSTHTKYFSNARRRGYLYASEVSSLWLYLRRIISARSKRQRASKLKSRHRFGWVLHISEMVGSNHSLQLDSRNARSTIANGFAENVEKLLNNRVKNCVFLFLLKFINNLVIPVCLIKILLVTVRRITHLVYPKTLKN